MHQPLDLSALLARRMILLSAALTVALLVHGVYEVVLIDRMLDDPDSGTAEKLVQSDDIAAWLGRLAGLAGLGTVIAWLIWHHAATRNLLAFSGPRPVRYQPGWAVGMWFVPLVNLLYPKAATDDLWRAREERDVPEVLNWWWVAWVATWVVGLISRGRDADTLEAWRTTDLWGIGGYVLYLVAAVLAMRVLTLVTERQLERAEELGVDLDAGRWRAEVPGARG